MSSREEDQLLQEFTPWGILRGKELYLSVSKALELIESAERRDLAVIGLEGFNLVGKELHVRLDLIADYSSTKASSWRAFRRVCNQAAARFIREAPLESNLVFNVVMTSSREHEEFWSTAQEKKRNQREEKRRQG